MEFAAIGTVWKIFPQLSVDVQKKIIERIAVYDRTYSRFNKTSTLYYFKENSGVFTLPSDGRVLFDLYQKLYTVTHAKVTPLIGEQLEAAGYDSSYSFDTQDIPQIKAWDDVFMYEYPQLIIKQPATIDIGAIGKGHLVDIISELLEAEEIEDYLVNAGGDIRSKGQSHTLYLESPDDASVAIGEVTLKDQSLCGSGIKRRKWGKYHHIIDPTTRQSVIDVSAVWVVADTTALADGLATALFFVSPEKLLKHFRFNYIVIKNGDLYASENMNFKLYTE